MDEMRQKETAYDACVPLLVYWTVNALLQLAAGALFSAPSETGRYALSAAVSTLSLLAALWTARGTARAVTFIREAPTPRRRLATAGAFLAAPGLAMLANAAVTRALAVWGLDGGQRTPVWPQNGAARMLLVIGNVLVPAVLEEGLFRGHGVTALLPLGRRWALLLSAGLFALCHPAVSVQAGAFVMGYILAWAYLRTGSLVWGMAVHGCNNGLALLQLARPQWADAIGRGVAAVSAVGAVLWLAAREKGHASDTAKTPRWFLTSAPFAAYVVLTLLLAIGNVEWKI